jgi:hypothetical protein
MPSSTAGRNPATQSSTGAVRGNSGKSKLGLTQNTGSSSRNNKNLIAPINTKNKTRNHPIGVSATTIDAINANNPHQAELTTMNSKSLAGRYSNNPHNNNRY